MGFLRPGVLILGIALLVPAFPARGGWLDVFSGELRQARQELGGKQEALASLGQPMIGNTVPEFGIQHLMLAEPPPESPFVQLDLGAVRAFDTVALFPAVVDFQGVT
ncbi:MAG: hypothetical protein ABL994_24035, partial [Verrucomicrobiales bacterium]